MQGSRVLLEEAHPTRLVSSFIPNLREMASANLGELVAGSVWTDP